MICQKWATEGHLTSSEHVKRIEEDAIGTLIGGKACSTRRFNGDMCTGVLTKKKMYDFWGDALENMPKRAKEIHLEKGVFFHGRQAISPAEARYELGVVSYPGDGKYDDTSIYVPFHEVPDVQEVASQKQLKMVSPPGQGWWPVIALKTVRTLSTKKVLVVCWYQLLSSGRVVCWWIYL